MNHFTLARRAAWGALALVGMLAFLAGCSKRVTGVDAGYTTLEGRPDANARLLAWTDTADTVAVWADLGSPGPDPNPDIREDTLYAKVLNHRTGPGVNYTLVLDRTAASGFQVFRRAGNGGLQAVADYPIQPEVKWLTSGWEVYSLADMHPSGYSPSTYVGRGLLDGRVTTNSPVTNLASVPAPAPRATIDWDFVAAPAAPTDSLFNLAWSPVPGAAGYWIHVYQFKSSATVDERRASGTPNPVLGGNVKHILVAYLAGSSNTSYKLGTPGPEVLTFVTPLRGQAYYARITAVDASGNVISWMRGDRMLYQMKDFYEYIPLGAVVLSPHR